jgi:hypothetical protein
MIKKVVSHYVISVWPVYTRGLRNNAFVNRDENLDG